MDTNPYISYFKHTNNSEKIFGEILSYTCASDLSIYNQEFPITLRTETYPTKLSGIKIKNCPEVAVALSKALFNCATFGTNHTLDYCEEGVEDTIKILKENGISAIGAGLNIKDAKKPFYFQKNNTKIAILNFAENEFNTANVYHGGANPLDIIDNFNQIQKVKNEVDFVLVIIHGGSDYCSYPSPRAVKQYRFYADAGASFIICHHSHVVSGFEIYKNTPIFFGIGNLIPGKIVVPGCLEGMALSISIHENNIKWEIIPLRFDEKKMELGVLKGSIKKIFLDRINKISEVIKDDRLLKTKYGEFLDTSWRKNDYIVNFNKKSRYFFRLLKKMRLLKLYSVLNGKSFKNTKKSNVVWNLIRCESHRDAMNHYYENDIDIYSKPKRK
jgi:poly-gamma-glutamate synthesis protein (capsule biosynthesis protein)